MIGLIIFIVKGIVVINIAAFILGFIKSIFEEEFKYD